jgi:hypothetical protein
VKCLLRHGLLFCEPGPSSLTEVEADESENEAETGEVGDDDDESMDET